MKKAMLSQPMAGKTDEEIIATREQAIKILEAKGYEIVNTLFTDEYPKWFLILLDRAVKELRTQRQGQMKP